MDDINKLVDILGNLNSPIQKEFVLARKILEEALVAEYESVVEKLSQILANVKFSPVVRMQAGLQLKNVVFSNDLDQKQVKQNRWLAIQEELRDQMKLNCFFALGTQHQGFHSAAQCVAYIACIEIPVNQWPNVIPSLVDNIKGGTATESLKQASLEALGYICKEINILTSQSDIFLIDIVLSNMSHDYCHMEQYKSTGVFEITLEIMNGVEDSMILVVIDFWSTVCVEEIRLTLDATECREQGLPPPEIQSKNFAGGALIQLVPILLKILRYNEKALDEDEMNSHKAAGECLALLSQCCEKSIVELVLPYVQAHIDHQDWQLRLSALMTLGGIIEVMSQLGIEGLVREMIPCISTRLKDQYPVVRDIAAWTISQVCKVFPGVTLNHECLPSLLHAMVNALSSKASTAIYVCLAIGQLAESAFNNAMNNMAEDQQQGEQDDHQGEPLTYKLSNYFLNLALKLLETANRDDYYLRNAAYLALMKLTNSAPLDCYSCFQRPTEKVIGTLKSLLEMADEPQNAQFVKHQSWLCYTIQRLMSKINRDDALTICDDTVNALITVLKRAQNIINQVLDGGDLNLSHYYEVQEDAMSAIYVIIDRVGPHFLTYLGEFKNILSDCLRRSAPRVCYSAAVVICSLAPHSPGLNNDFFEDIFIDLRYIISNTKTPEPLVITALGVLAIFRKEFRFEFRHEWSYIVHGCKMAGLNNADNLDYLNSFRTYSIYTFTSLMHGFRSDHPLEFRSEFSSRINDIIKILEYVEPIGEQAVTSDELIGACCGLIGMIAASIDKNCLILIDMVAIRKLVDQALISNNVSTRRRGAWALNMLNHLLAS